MLFSYYFDTDKTHLLNCRFRVLQFAEKAEGVIEIMFSAEISEWQHNTRKRRETKVATFSFPPAPEGQMQHDIDFSRVRYADDRKWIFTVINNKQAAQRVEVGLISSTANKNPLGMDIYHDDDQFEAELKANNLSILPQGYVPPVLTQTMVSAQFDQAGYPEGFSSISARYDAVYQNYRLADFTQSFLEPIPAGAPFDISLDIAPSEVTPLTGMHVLEVVIPNLGRFSLLTNGMEFLLQDGRTSDIERVFFPQSIAPADFWNNGMTSKAKLSIKGDGNGLVTIRYYDHTLEAVYDPTRSFNRIEFRGAVARGN